MANDECDFEAGSHYSLWQRTQAKTVEECESDCFSYAHSKDKKSCQSSEDPLQNPLKYQQKNHGELKAQIYDF